MTSKAISAPSLSSSSSGTASKRQSLSRTPPPNGGGGSGGNGSGAGGSMDGDEDRITGHCVISLEQLCKVALSGSISSEGAIAATTVARLLVNKGRPMYNIDTKAMQVSSTHPSHQHPTHESADAIEVMLSSSFSFAFSLCISLLHYSFRSSVYLVGFVGGVLRMCCVCGVPLSFVSCVPFHEQSSRCVLCHVLICVCILFTERNGDLLLQA